MLEAARRAFNVVFEVDGGRRFIHRKFVDLASTFVLTTLVLAVLILRFVGGGVADEAFGLIGLGETATNVWNVGRWPAVLFAAVILFSFLYYVTPDVRQRGPLWVMPGAVLGVLLWITVSAAFSTYIEKISNVTAFYGAFGSVIVLLVWIWLSNMTLLLGAQLNAEIEREKELSEGVDFQETLNLPPRQR